MNKLIESVRPNYPVKLKVTTAGAQGSSVYIFSEPDAEGIRTIQRNEDAEFQGKIIGPVMELSEVTVDEVKYLTEFGDKRVVVIGDEIKVGFAMGVGYKDNPDNTLVSRPITSIEVL